MTRPLRRPHRRLVPLLAVPLFLAAGCGGGTGRNVPVEGTVTFRSALLGTGSITFHPDAARGNTSPDIAVGSITAGKYTAATGERVGVRPGWYKVTVVATVPSNPKDEYSQPVSVVGDVYGDPATTPLQAEVKPDGGPYDFALGR